MMIVGGDHLKTDATKVAVEYTKRWGIAGPVLLRRHGGRSTDVWRIVATPTTLERANEKFVKLNEAMRQGGVALYGADEQGVRRILRIATAPRLRSRW
jgi:hypothetical protein